MGSEHVVKKSSKTRAQKTQKESSKERMDTKRKTENAIENKGFPSYVLKENKTEGLWKGGGS